MNSFQEHKLINLLLGLGIGICLFQIWYPPYFLTGDNPSHLNNTFALNDLVKNGSASFFSSYFTINSSANANWFSHMFIAILLNITTPALAEKILFTSYLILFSTGLYKLMKFHNPVSNFSFLTLFFVAFNILLIKGFVNFIFSVAFIPWVILFYLLFIQDKSILKGAVCIIASSLLFILHPVSYLIALVAILSLTIFYMLEYSSINFYTLTRRASLVFAMNIPFVLLSIYFNESHNTTPFTLCVNWKSIPILFLQGSAFNCYSANEKWICFLTAVILVSVLCYELFKVLKNKSFRETRLGYIMTLFVVMLIYVFVPAFYVEHLEIRLQLIGFLFIVLFISTSTLNLKIQQYLNVFLFLLFILLSIVRFPIIIQQSDAIVEMMEVNKYIQPNKTLLSICFNKKGTKVSGENINEINGSFIHAANYLGATKYIFMLDNYEANTTWFPLKFKPHINPYLCENFTIEAEPPFVDIAKYEQQSNINIDYILISFMNINGTQQKIKKMLNDISINYNLIYTSSKNRNKLYQRR
jgi:hypothetical protein